MALRKILPLLFVSVFNLWLIKIFFFSIFIAIILVLSSIFIYLALKTDEKKYLYLSAVALIILTFFQFRTSTIDSLTYLNEREKVEQRQKMTGYPRHFFKFANWLEQRKEAVMFYKIEKNFFEVVDPNLYFFANHPRERIGIVEYEKFPYIFLPFFIAGILLIKKSDINILVVSLSPLVLLSLIGSSNPIGPFSLFPALAAYTASGLEPVLNNRKYFLVFVIVFSLIFIQTISYATY